ncbi:hypothetical protein H6G20_18895 [Desertifilum sp. FACHB-1129]|uniref:Uncharacterized protein n=2 Tax=Desertifilum tharense IPPAS B-1220 TaxID=1781255 RepID=A0A1E5QG48_9CYAN|nr:MULTISPECIES: hypothetical protein [Desertifilum]MDA0209993.1 hypothetical protein [Cyanobacteria bacterium FC1]MBD2313740.1 hypothetical protein [Desertifilum sp. FACHB-1129]MBD2324550.1 hypothetical protein [Desertifilum sp. FACHB-866]MBD2334564.1 hypothetical protein [Desertifilum sp. FACHB-868]OEJ73662.1 hypothetical protein BH720_18590 [Desertifilum tharense IPPAS B-1220]
MIDCLKSLFSGQKEKRIYSNPSLESESFTQKYVLLLVVEADANPEMIQQLKEEPRITSELLPYISSISLIQGIWQGSESEYKELFNIDHLFQESSKREELYSEYDIHLIKIVLDERQPEFSEGNNSLNWYDGFRKISLLTQEKYKLEISERLSSDVTDGFDSKLYR